MKDKSHVIDKVFWSAYNRYWEKLEQPASSVEQVEKIINLLLENGAKPGQRVIDAGCGNGLYSLALAKNGFRATGVDFAPGVLASAQRKAEQQHLNADFEKMDLDNHFWFADGYFDHAFCLSVLNLLNRPKWALNELHRILKPGGLLIVSLWLDPVKYRESYPEMFQPSTANSNGVKDRAKQAARNLSGRSIHTRFWSVEEFQDLLTKQGFEILQMGGSPMLLAVARRA
ncbi:MAG TPA: class I SAM-dependent methyltransferase [Chloroflexia bacterium]|nr:class I SAM-dependent methyltransferase [Chloroflexia bacterium]